MAETTTFIPYVRDTYSPEEMRSRSRAYRLYLETRRTVREFSERWVPQEVIEEIIMAASTAPSGAHKQPWTFCAVSNPDVKRQIREAAEAEEYRNYHGRMSETWLEDIAPFGTDWEKPFLEIAPWLIVVFRRAYETVDGETRQNYYVNESVGLAAGMLLAAIHQAGLVALTHTPSPMNFLCEVLARPKNERPFLLIPVGYPADEVRVPDLQRKSPGEVIAYYT